MQIFHFRPGHAPQLAGAAEIEDWKQGFFWLDVERSEAEWHDTVRRLLGLRIDEQHVRDSFNTSHPPYYDGTDDYDILVVRSYCRECPPDEPLTRPVAVFVSDQAVISIRPPGDPVFAKLHQRLLANQRTPPGSPVILLHQVLNQVVESLLESRSISAEQLTCWQDRILERDAQFDEWRALMRLRGNLRRLEVVSEGQMDALESWREQTRYDLDSSLAVRFNDLGEHLRRVYNHALVTQHDIDSLVQIYFSATSQRTNDVLKILTIVSAVFLPLNLLAGLFGMNFVDMPLLRWDYGLWLVLGLMVVIVVGLLTWFRRRQWM